MRILLALLCLLLATPVLAVPVDQDAPDGVASRFTSDATMFVLSSNGETWYHSYGGSSWVLFAAELPVPITEIVDWYPKFVTTADGSIWRYDLSQWVVVDPLPFAPVANESQNIDNLKSMFR